MARNITDVSRLVGVIHPGAGVFHVVAGEKRRYDYPRWQFSNRSDDIRELCCEVPWRQSGPWTISVSRREAVGVLDELIGPKS